MHKKNKKMRNNSTGADPVCGLKNLISLKISEPNGCSIFWGCRQPANRTLACISRTRHARSPQRVARAAGKSHSRLHSVHSTRTISAEGCAGSRQIEQPHAETNLHSNDSGTENLQPSFVPPFFSPLRTPPRTEDEKMFFVLHSCPKFPVPSLLPAPSQVPCPQSLSAGLCPQTTSLQFLFSNSPSPSCPPQFFVKGLLNQANETTDIIRSTLHNAGEP